MKQFVFVLTALFWAAAAAASHTKVYIANQGSNTVTVIDDQRLSALATSRAAATPGGDHAAVANQDFAVVATIPVGANPIAVGLSADGMLAYVANLNSHNLSVIDTSTDEVVGTVAAGPNPRDVEATPDGRYILVVNQSTNSVTVLDASNYSLVASVPVGNFPCAIAIAPDGSAAYITNRLSNDVSIIDLDTLQVANVGVGAFACDVMVTPDGRWAVVTNRLSANITIIDTATRVVVATVATGTNPQGVAFSADGGTAYVTNASTVSVVDMNSFAVVGTVTGIPSGPCPVASTMERNRADGGHVYVASNTINGVVRVVEAASGSVIAVVNTGSRPAGIGIRMWPMSMSMGS